MFTDVTCLDATATELATLRQEKGPGLSEDELLRTKVPLDEIAVAPKAFQHRDGGYRSWDKDGHIHKLVKDLKMQDRHFDPLQLYAIDGYSIVLDGHCRLMAYREAEFPGDTKVPVEYYRGDFREAYAQPAVRNSKEVLNLTHRERLEAAWSYVLFDEGRGWYSLRDIEGFTTISSSTVGNMRNELENDDEYDFDPREFSWYNFKRKRKDKREISENQRERRAEAMADRMRSALGNEPNVSPDIFFDALEIGYGDLIPYEIPREWAVESAARDAYLKKLESKVEGEDFEF